MVRHNSLFRWLRKSWIVAGLALCCLWTLGCEPPTATQNVAPSQTARIKFKGPTRLANNLSMALQIEKTELCRELGKYDCFSEAHRVALKGVEPYQLSIRVPWEISPLGAPIVTERVAMASCTERAKRDFADGSKAVIFKPVVGQSEPSASAREEVVTTLYKRLLLRLPTNEEKSKLVGFWDKVKEKSQKPAQDWSTLVCFGLVTSTEFLFY
ncbi:MAG: hypothetical protein EP343_31445 [Deltaproteobacteria bacterium]|nr:MAG: hypothetical protein EP343_31445 [Deltaproteobacteria bacterium]